MNRLKLLLLVGSLFLICACKKKKEVDATLFVNVVYNKMPVANPTVYLQGGGMHNPQIPLSQYQEIKEGDGTNEIVFTNLAEGDYFLYATAKISGSVTAMGSISISMVRKEMPNSYIKTIYVE